MTIICLTTLLCDTTRLLQPYEEKKKVEHFYHVKFSRYVNTLKKIK